jgi:hypothetical protein
MKRYLLPVLLGIVGWAFAWGLWHLYVDHQRFHIAIGDYAVPRAQPQPPPKEESKP